MPRFDFNEMAGRSLGTHWRRLNVEERRRFVEVFTRFLEQNYMTKISPYNGERFLYADKRVGRALRRSSARLLMPAVKESGCDTNSDLSLRIGRFMTL